MRWWLACLLVALPALAAAEPVRAPVAEVTGGVVIDETPIEPSLGLRAGARLDRVMLLLGVDRYQIEDVGGDYEREETRLRTQLDVVVREPVFGATYLRFRLGVGVERTKVVETYTFITYNMRTEVAYRPSAEGAIGFAHDVGRVSFAAEFGLVESGAASARFDMLCLAVVGARL